MTKYQKTRIPNDLRQAVFKRDGYTCRYCGSMKGPFHCDHVYPERHGGKAVLGNLVTACKRCNIKKRDKIGIWPSQSIDLDQLKETRRMVARKESAIRNQRALIAKMKNEQSRIIEKTSDAIAKNNRRIAEHESKRARIADNMKMSFLFIGVASACGYMLTSAHDLEISMLFVLFMWLDLCGWISLSAYTKLTNKPERKS